MRSRLAKSARAATSPGARHRVLLQDRLDSHEMGPAFFAPLSVNRRVLLVEQPAEVPADFFEGHVLIARRRRDRDLDLLRQRVPDSGRTRRSLLLLLLPEVSSAPGREPLEQLSLASLEPTPLQLVASGRGMGWQPVLRPAPAEEAWATFAQAFPRTNTKRALFANVRETPLPREITEEGKR